LNNSLEKIAHTYDVKVVPLATITNEEWARIENRNEDRMRDFDFREALKRDVYPHALAFLALLPFGENRSTYMIKLKESINL